MKSYYEEFVKGKNSEEIIAKMGDVARPGSPVYEMMKEAARAKALKESKGSRGILNHPIIKIIGVCAATLTIIMGILFFI